MKRKIISVLLCVLLLASLLPVSAFADTTASGTCGDNLTWTLDSDGTLTISGTGAMEDFSCVYKSDIDKWITEAPWGEYYEAIERVVIENGVTSIGWRAFYGCSSLESVMIPDSVTSIGSYEVFYGCSSLTSVTIPNSVTDIGDGAFEGCGNLTSITVDKGNEYYCSDNGVLFSKDKTELHTYPAGKSAASYVIPDSVTFIGGYAFSGCSSLESVTIPDSVASIESNPFEGCGNLTNITVDKGNEYYCSKNGVLFSKDYEYYYEDGEWFSKDKIELHTYPAGKSAASYIIPDSVASISVTSIGDDAFCGCRSLKSVTIPDSVTSIGWYAFEDCSSLTSVTIPDSVTSIGNSAFIGCSSLTSVTIPDSVTSIEDYAFYGCNSLESVTIPDSVTSIEMCAFYGCSSLESVTIPDSVTSMGEHAFYNCSSLTSITIPDSVTSIGGWAFYRCSSLTSVTISDGVTSIGQMAFSDCTSLMGVTVPASVTNIGVSAFSDCSSMLSITVDNKNKYYCSDDGVLFNKDRTELHTYPAGKPNTSYAIPNSVTNIKSYAFEGCSSLTSVTIGIGVTYIGYSAFRWLNLTDVYYGGTASQWKAISIGDDNDPLLNAKLHYAGEPAVPAAPVIKITTSAGKPKVSWSKVDGAAKYQVFYSTDGKKYNKLIETTKTSVTHTGAKIGTTYYYKVKAVNSNGAESVYSNTKSIKCVPAAPTVTISRSGGKAKLSWKAVTGATKYWVYRSTDGKNYTRVISTTKLTYTDSNSKSGTKYYYKVRAIAVVNNTNVGSAYSTAKSITTTLAKPTVKITTSNGKPKLSWSKVTGAYKYYIYRSTDGKTFSYLTYTTKLTYTNTGAKKNTKYYYKVKAICSSSTAANSAYSAVVSIKATK